MGKEKRVYIEERKRTEAAINPEAVKKARLFLGRIAYYDPGVETMVEYNSEYFVQVGSWTARGEEQTTRDHLDTFHAAGQCSLGSNMELLPTTELLSPGEAFSTGETSAIQRRWIISQRYDHEGNPVPFETKEDAQKVIDTINEQLEYMRSQVPPDIR